jgi:hypothetical protein
MRRAVQARRARGRIEEDLPAPPHEQQPPLAALGLSTAPAAGGTPKNLCTWPKMRHHGPHRLHAGSAGVHSGIKTMRRLTTMRITSMSDEKDRSLHSDTAGCSRATAVAMPPPIDRAWQMIFSCRK